MFNAIKQYPGPGTYSVPLEIINGQKYSMSTKVGLQWSQFLLKVKIKTKIVI